MKKLIGALILLAAGVAHAAPQPIAIRHMFCSAYEQYEAYSHVSQERTLAVGVGVAILIRNGFKEWVQDAWSKGATNVEVFETFALKDEMGMSCIAFLDRKPDAYTKLPARQWWFAEVLYYNR